MRACRGLGWPIKGIHQLTRRCHMQAADWWDDVGIENWTKADWAASNNALPMGPLAPWLVDFNAEAFKHRAIFNAYYLHANTTCVILDATTWGLGSSMNGNFWLITLAQAIYPGLSLYYNHATSPYQCSTNGSLDAFMIPASNGVFKVGDPPPGCAHHTYHAGESEHFRTGIFPGHTLWNDWHITEAGASPALVLRNKLYHQASIQAVCQTVQSFWNLSPELSLNISKTQKWLRKDRQLVIAIQARGGDKVIELQGHLDGSRHYPMEAGMWKLSLNTELHGATCVIIGDELTYAEAISHAAKLILKCGRIVIRHHGMSRDGHRQAAFNSMPLEERCTATQNYIADLEILAWADYMIVNDRSNVAEVANYIRRCKYHHPRETAISGEAGNIMLPWTTRGH